MAFKRIKISEFSGGEYPQTPPSSLPFGAHMIPQSLKDISILNTQKVVQSKVSTAVSLINTKTITKFCFLDMPELQKLIFSIRKKKTAARWKCLTHKQYFEHSGFVLAVKRPD